MGRPRNLFNNRGFELWDFCTKTSRLSYGSLQWHFFCCLYGISIHFIFFIKKLDFELFNELNIFYSLHSQHKFLETLEDQLSFIKFQRTLTLSMPWSLSLSWPPLFSFFFLKNRFWIGPKEKKLWDNKIPQFSEKSLPLSDCGAMSSCCCLLCPSFTLAWNLDGKKKEKLFLTI